MPRRKLIPTEKNTTFEVQISVELHDFEDDVMEVFSVKIAQYSDGSVKAIFDPPGGRKFKKTFASMEDFRQYCRDNEEMLNGVLSSREGSGTPSPSSRDSSPF